jgi:hypothetical protein
MFHQALFRDELVWHQLQRAVQSQLAARVSYMLGNCCIVFFAFTFDAKELYVSDTLALRCHLVLRFIWGMRDIISLI